MNSALQCLSNTWPFTSFFLGKHFMSEINEDNVLGSRGELVFNYVNFLSNAWVKEKDNYSPNQLKRCVGNINIMVTHLH